MIKMKVITPTTPAAIHAPCHSDKDASLTLVTPSSNPSPDTFEQPVRSNTAGTTIPARDKDRL